MARANSFDDPWELPEDHPKNCRNIADRTKALSLDDKSEVGADDSSNELQPFGGFSAPKTFSENIFGGNLNLQRGLHDRNSKHGRVVDGSYSNGNRGTSFNPASRNLFECPAQQEFGNTSGGGIRSVKPVDSSGNDGNLEFGATNPMRFDTNSGLSRQNLPSENSNQPNSMGQFAAPVSAADLSISSGPPQFGGNSERWINRRNRPEGEGGSELKQQNLETEKNISVDSTFPKDRNFSSNAGNVRVQQTFRAKELSAMHTLSLEEREKNFWKQAACRSSPFVPMQMTTPSTPKFGGFAPPASGRPLYGRGLCVDEQSGKSFDTVPPFSASTSQRKAVVNIDQKTSQYDGDRSFPKDEYEKPMPNEEISLLNKILHKKLENLQNGSLEISQARTDPNSPLYSVTSFQSLRLRDELLKALDKMGFYMPSKIQEAALPLLLVEPPMNLIAQAQSGTGKTATFVLTMLSRVVSSNKWPQCLCLAPTYELAMQIGQVVKKMSEFLPEIEIRYAVKGERMLRGEKIEEQIIIGTPGKMLDWVTKLKVIDPSKIICLVLDEADVMISQQGHQDQSIRLHKYVCSFIF
uniref:RNA helicase n=1 Tax=Elaeophora elaphi TaxID=1147741 RepID=A0A0R3RID3_9BILA